MDGLTDIIKVILGGGAGGAVVAALWLRGYIVLRKDVDSWISALGRYHDEIMKSKIEELAKAERREQDLRSMLSDSVALNKRQVVISEVAVDKLAGKEQP